jgi:hypothetical protein
MNAFQDAGDRDLVCEFSNALFRELAHSRAPLTIAKEHQKAICELRVVTARKQESVFSVAQQIRRRPHAVGENEREAKIHSFIDNDTPGLSLTRGENEDIGCHESPCNLRSIEESSEADVFASE